MANMQMCVKKLNYNNLNSKRKKWSVGKTTEKKNFSNYSIPILSSKLLEFAKVSARSFFFVMITEKSACGPPFGPIIAF